MRTEVRKGKVEDVPGALALIRELAVYEKAPQAVIVTEEEMKVWAAGENPLFRFFVLSIGNEIKGLALYYYKYSTWKGPSLFLEDIVVTETERRKGYGHLLFTEVAKVAASEGMRRMEWQVLEWNEPAISFYKKHCVNFDEEWINCSFSSEQLERFK